MLSLNILYADNNSSLSDALCVFSDQSKTWHLIGKFSGYKYFDGNTLGYLTLPFNGLENHLLVNDYISTAFSKNYDKVNIKQMRYLWGYVQEKLGFKEVSINVEEEYFNWENI